MYLLVPTESAPDSQQQIMELCLECKGEMSGCSYIHLWSSV